MRLLPLVTKFLTEFIPATYGYSENKLQIEYAHSLVNWLEGRGLALIEADTGTGKTLGYLAPIMLAVSLNPKLKICISTETISLQRQILNESEKVARFLESENITPISPVAYRGVQNYLDPIALNFLIEEWLIDGTIDIASSEALEKSARKEIVSGEGLLSTFIEANAELLPSSFNPNILALTAENSDSNPAYNDMREDIEYANIEVCSHVRTSSLLKYTNSKEYDFVLFDEADALPRICDAISRARISKGMLNRGKSAIADMARTTPGKKVSESIDYLVEILAAGNEDKSDDKNFHFHQLFRECIDDLAQAFAWLLKSEPHAFSSLSLKRQHSITSLIRYCTNAPNSNFTKCIFGSTVKTGDYIEIGDLFATSFVKNRHEKDRISFCFTSATMSDATNELSFNSIKHELMIQKSTIAIEKKYEPTSFGSMQFRTPRIDDGLYPFIQSSDESDEAVYNTKWLDTLARLIESLAEQEDARTLILFPSYRDIDVLLECSPSLVDRVAVHKRGVRGTAAAKLLVKSGVLLSATLWTGFSERMPDGSQLFSNLVVSRLPHPPADKFAFRMLADYYKTSGDAFAEDKANRNLRLNGHVASLRKFKQALGRPIRNSNDSAIIYVCDSRASLGSKRGAQLGLAIPKRFRQNYIKALNLFDVRASSTTDSITKKDEMKWLF